MTTPSLDLLADTLADSLERGATPTTFPDRRDLVLLVAGLVRRHGAADALATIRLVLGSAEGYHDTLVVFTVWAVDRLLAAGLTTTALLWHPLTTAGTEYAWWDEATFDGEAAARAFVAPTRWSAGDPMPAEPRHHLAVAV